MLQIDFLQYKSSLKTKTEKNKRFIYDPIRKKYLVLQPEEFVRQLVLIHLIQEAHFNPNRISVEKALDVNGLRKRCDILIYNQQIQPWFLVECKAANINITQATFDQIARYNMPLQVDYLMVTNGILSYCCQLDYKNNSYQFLDTLPSFPL